jgi:HlyD family secretion protein
MMPRVQGKHFASSVALLAASALAACGSANAGERNGSLEVAAVEQRDLLIRVDASGEVEPLRLVEVKSNAGGEILRLLVDTGDDIAQGALMADINPRDVRNSFLQAQADVEVARAHVATRESALRRAQELRQANIMTLQEFEAAQLDMTQARAQLIKAQTSLDLARERMGDITIRAPITGTVVQKNVEAGQIIASATGNVSGGTTLFIMADLARMRVRALVDQTDIGKLQIGQTARITVDAFPDRNFVGVVTKVEPMARVEQNVTMFPVLIELDNPDRLLLPGMNADVEITVNERRGVATVPNEAVMNVRNAVAAASALGLSEDAYRAALRSGQGQASAAGAPAGADSGECMQLIQRLRSGGGRDALSEAERARLQECRAQFDGLRPGGVRPGGQQLRRPGSSAAAAEGRPGVIFVSGPNGPEPRMVTIGLNDLDHTEVLRGVEVGEQVILVSATQLHQQQQQALERMRQRTGGLPGTGSAAGRR